MYTTAQMDYPIQGRKGFTLIELLVVISIIAILSTVGLVTFTNVRKSAQDAKIKSDINAIAKAYEQKFDPSAGGGQGAYKTISTNDFAGGAIPTGTSDKTYGGFLTAEAKGFRICSPVMSSAATTCSVESPTCYCKTSTQGAGSNLGYTPGGASGGDFTYRAPVTITNNSGGALTNFQVGVSSFNTQSLIGANKMKSDCTDLRVTDSNGVAIPYWIESGCNSSNTSVWVKPASLVTGENTIYFYYGNSSATDAADANAVFELYDDFNSSTINLSKWNVTICRDGSGNPVPCNIIPAQSGGNLNITGTITSTAQQNNVYGVTSVGTFSNFIVETRFNTVTPSNEYKANVGTIFGLASLKRSGGTLAVKYYSGGWNTLFASGYGSSGYTVFTEKVQPSRVDWFENNILKGFRTISPASGSQNIFLIAGPDIKDVPFDAKYDWVRVRKYASSDPGTSIGPEQAP